MLKARAFFFVCAGLFLLALCYHLGARSAGAQSAGNPVVAVIPEGGTGWMLAMAANGDTYRTTHTVPSRTYAWELVGHVPSGSPVVAMTLEGTGWVLAMAANGDTYRTTHTVGTRTYDWELVGSVSGATPTTQETWGSLKSRYRGEREAAQPAPVGR